MTGSMDDTVRIPLTTEEKADAGERIGHLIAQRDAMEASRKKAMEDAKADIDTIQGQIDELAQDLREGRTEKRQGDLFHAENLPPAQATAALGKIARLPSEPHPYEGKRKECGICGAGREDPIHGEAQTSAEQPPKVRPIGEGRGRKKDREADA